MSGVDVIGELLAAYAPLVAVVPVGSMAAAKLPDGIGLPSLVVRKISGVDYQELAPGQTIRVTQRLQVTVRSANDQQRGDIVTLVKLACSDRTAPSLGGVTNVSVLSAGEGPDFNDDAGSIFMGSHDFMASYLISR